MAMRTIFLYGDLRKKFGKSFRMDVSTLAEACRAIGSQIEGFQKAIVDGRFRVTCGESRGKGWRLGEEQCGFRLPAGDLHIVPVMTGAKRSGIGKIILGVLIAAVAWWAAPAIGGLGATLIGGMTYGNVAMMGVGMVLTGLSQVISSAGKQKQQQPVPQNESFVFNGVANVEYQGGPVALIYGRTLVGSTVISAGITTEEYADHVALEGATA